MGRGPLIAVIAGTFATAAALSCCGSGAVALRPRSIAKPEIVAVPMTGSMVLTTDGTLLYSIAATCDDFDGTVTASPTAVTVRLTHAIEVPVDCAPQTRIPRTIPFRLGGPLGDRPVIDATSGTTLPVFAQRGALRPTDPPIAGYVTVSFGGVGSLAPGFGGPGSATLAEEFHEPDVYDPAQPAIIWIVQTTGRWNQPPGLVTTPVTVRGNPGRQAPGILVWTENGRTVAIVWQPPPHDNRPAPNLIDIARHLVRTDAGR